MTKTNKEIILECNDYIFNAKRLELFDEYYSPECITHNPLHIGTGIRTDDKKVPGKVIIVNVAPGGPSAGKLQEGDEILRVSDGVKSWETYQDLKEGLWGQGGLGVQLTFRVHRNEQDLEYFITRSAVRSFDLTMSNLKDEIRRWYHSI